MENIYVQMKQITKSFGGVPANNRVDLDVRRGEIHALLGENGSGKSTLMNILSGIYKPDDGSIYIGGQKQLFSSPKDAINAGVGMIHQHFKLVEVFSATENIVAGTPCGLLLDRRQLRDKIADLGERYGLRIDPDTKVYNMSISEKQTVEILKVLYRGAEVLILDEPTAVLTPQETSSLFNILRNMKEKGCAVILITHKLNEVLEISDRVTLLRKGERIASLRTADADQGILTEKMVGKAVSLNIPKTESPDNMKSTLLDIRDLTVSDRQGYSLVDQVSLQVRAGEIHGIAGIAGSGQKELSEAVAGMLQVKSGQILFDGSNITGLSPRQMKKLNIEIGFVPEDRLGMGLAPGMNIADNILIRSYQESSGLLIDRGGARQKALEIIELYDVAASGVDQTISKLSGGNIQKVLLGREIQRQAKLLITAYPVRGLDIVASHLIYRLLDEERKKGVGVLFLGEDLDVLLAVCDRISVMCHGKKMATLEAREATKEKIGLLMMGKKGAEEEIA